MQLEPLIERLECRQARTFAPSASNRPTSQPPMKPPPPATRTLRSLYLPCSNSASYGACLARPGLPTIRRRPVDSSFRRLPERPRTGLQSSRYRTPAQHRPERCDPTRFGRWRRQARTRAEAMNATRSPGSTTMPARAPWTRRVARLAAGIGTKTGRPAQKYVRALDGNRERVRAAFQKYKQDVCRCQHFRHRVIWLERHEHPCLEDRPRDSSGHRRLGLQISQRRGRETREVGFLPRSRSRAGSCLRPRVPEYMSTVLPTKS